MLPDEAVANFLPPSSLILRLTFDFASSRTCNRGQKLHLSDKGSLLVCNEHRNDGANEAQVLLGQSVDYANR